MRHKPVRKLLAALLLLPLAALAQAPEHVLGLVNQ
jgi:hypothetical protein